MIDRTTSAAGHADNQCVEWGSSPGVDWMEFHAAREFLFARLRRQSELHRLERAWEARPHSSQGHGAPAAARREILLSAADSSLGVSGSTTCGTPTPRSHCRQASTRRS